MKQDAEHRLQRAQTRYDAADALLDELESVLPKLASLAETMGPLMTYYSKQWAADREAAPDLMVGVAGEDTIWNLHGRQYELMRELLRHSSRYFTDPD